MLLQDLVALVTGAATGIGEAISRLFAAEGARVHMFDRDGDGCKNIAAEITHSGGIALPFAGDVRNPAQVSSPVRSAIEQFGKVDVLINNAGIFPRRAFLEMTEQ